MVAYIFPNMGFGIISMFLGVYLYKTETALGRTAVWIAFKFSCYLSTRLWAKMTCYAMRNDIQFLLLVFMMVINRILLFSPRIPIAYAHCRRAWRVVSPLCACPRVPASASGCSNYPSLLTTNHSRS